MSSVRRTSSLNALAEGSNASGPVGDSSPDATQKGAGRNRASLVGLKIYSLMSAMKRRHDDDRAKQAANIASVMTQLREAGYGDIADQIESSASCQPSACSVRHYSLPASLQGPLDRCIQSCAAHMSQVDLGVYRLMLQLHGQQAMQALGDRQRLARIRSMLVVAMGVGGGFGDRNREAQSGRDRDRDRDRVKCPDSARSLPPLSLPSRSPKAVAGPDPGPSLQDLLQGVLEGPACLLEPVGDCGGERSVRQLLEYLQEHCDLQQLRKGTVLQGLLGSARVEAEMGAGRSLAGALKPLPGISPERQGGASTARGPGPGPDPDPSTAHWVSAGTTLPPSMAPAGRVSAESSRKVEASEARDSGEQLAEDPAAEAHVGGEEDGYLARAMQLMHGGWT